MRDLEPGGQTRSAHVQFVVVTEWRLIGAPAQREPCELIRV